MMKFTKTRAAVSVVAALGTGVAMAQTGEAETQIIQVVDQYEAALNASNAAAIVQRLDIVRGGGQRRVVIGQPLVEPSQALQHGTAIIQRLWPAGPSIQGAGEAG